MDPTILDGTHPSFAGLNMPDYDDDDFVWSPEDLGKGIADEGDPPYKVDTYTDAEIQEAIQLKTYTPASRKLAIFCRITGRLPATFLVPRHEWTGTMDAEYCACIVTIPRDQVENIPDGLYDAVSVAALMDQDVKRIKASLLVPKKAATTLVTDRTLVGLVCAMSGASATLPAEAVTANLSVPASPGLGVSVVGGNAGRVTSGVPQFLSWYNSKFSPKLRFCSIPESVRRVASLFLSNEVPVITDGNPITFKVRNWPPPTLLNLPPIPPKLLGAFKPLKRMFSWGVASFEGGIGVGYTKERRAFCELAFSRAAARDKTWGDTIEAIGVEYLKFVELQYAKVMAAASALRPIDLAKGAVIPCTNSVAINQGKIYEYVEKHRSIYRSQLDVERKHDSPGLGLLSDGGSSVPVKFSPIFAYLVQAGVSPKEIFAVGTHRQNHWHKTITTSFPDVPIRWADKEGSYRPPLLGVSDHNFEVFDIAGPGTEAQGWYAGGTIFDDTLPYEKIGVKEVCSQHRKLEALARSDADVIVTKLYYGAGSFGEFPVGRTPLPITQLAAKYRSARFFPGGGPHSQEYFLVLHRRERAWFPVMPLEGGAYRVASPTESGTVLENQECPIPDAWVKYSQSWHLLKGHELICANMSQSTQAVYGLLLRAYQPSLRAPHVNLIYMSGSHIGVQLAKAVSAMAVPSVKDDDFVI